MKQSNLEEIKFAYWVPNVSGGLVISKIPQRTSWDFKYNKRLAQTAEQNGFEYALTQIRFTAGYGAENQHESVTFSQALLAETDNLKLIAAILPGPWNPVVLAKQVATISHLSNGRLAVNIVSGWFKGEFHAIGEYWLDHDERYRRSEEFIQAIRGMWSIDDFSQDGAFYRFKNYTLSPKPIKTPEIFQGGNSQAAKEMAARVSDWYFINGNTLEGIEKEVKLVRTEAAKHNREIKVGINAFVIARDTEEQAQEVLRDILKHADSEAIAAFDHEVKNAGRASKEGQGMWSNSTIEDLVQYNDGFKTNLIGTPEQIADRIIEYKKIGVDLILTAHLHYIEDIEFFGKQIIPLVRSKETLLAQKSA